MEILASGHDEEDQIIDYESTTEIRNKYDARSLSMITTYSFS